MQFLKIKQKNGEMVTVPIGTEPINSIVSSHNADPSAHADIREQISQLSSEKVVLYSAQTLTDEERAQVRANIGAASAEKETTYTNLADPTSSDWKDGYRIGSTGLSANSGTTVTNLIQWDVGDVIRITGISGFKVGETRVCDTSDSTLSGSYAYVDSLPTDYFGYEVVDGVHTFILLKRTNSANKYFRVCFITPTDPSTVIITKNEEIVESGDTRIEALEVQIEKIEDRVTALENNATVIPDYWEEHITSKITEIKTLQEEGGEDCFSFVTIADMHYPSNLGKNSPILAKEVLDKCDIRYALCLGDVQTRGCHATKELLLAENEEIEKMLAPIRDRLLQTEGNHDGSYGLLDRDGNGEYNNRDSEGNVKEPAQRETYVNNLTPAELHSAIYRKVGLVGETHFDESGSGYYIDDTANKVRYIILNTHCNDYELQADGTSKYPKMWLFRFTQPQFDLVIEALNNIPSDSWSVVVAGHCPLYQEIGDREVMQGVLNAYKNKTTYSGEYAGTADSTISYTNLADQSSGDWLNNFRFNSSWVQTAAAGVDVTNFIPVTYHTKLHVKGLDIMTDLPNGTNYGRIYFYNNQKEPLEQLTPSGIKQEWFVTAEYNSDVMIIDIANIMAYYSSIQSEVAYIRLGGISSNNIIITDNEEIIGYTIGGYTNQLPLAVDSDKATIYNSKGYKDGARLSSSGKESTITGGFLTGYIPIKIGQTIRLNGNYIKTDWKYYGMANTGFYLEDLTSLSIANMGIFTNNNQYFTNVVTNDEGYVIQFSLNPNWTYLENWSDLAYMRFTLIGSGEDCIITVDEEIVEKEEILPEGGKGYDYVSVDCDFSNAKGELVGYFAGHTHRDAVNSAYGFNIITTRCDGHEENVDGDSSTTEDDELYNERVAGTITEQSFDVFTVNKKTHKIYATKIGAGDNRIIEYPASVIGTEPINSIVSAHNADPSAHADIREEISQLSSEINGIPDYVKTEAEEVADKVIANRTANSLVLLMGTDIHEIASEDENFDNNKTAIKHLGMGMAEIRKNTRPDAVVLLGDYVYGTTTLDKAEAKSAMKRVIESLYNATNGIPSIWLDGNHDHYQTSGDYRLTDGENYALVGANNSNDVEVDADNLTRNYGYIDFKKQRIRLIYLNTTDISGDVASSNYITNTQGQWLINTALDMSGKDDADKWGIVVCSHFPIYTEQVSTGTLIFPDLKEVICAYKDKSSGTAYGTSYDFSSVKAELIATFHGHLHNFKVTDVETDGGNTIKAICIPNGCPNRENPYGGVFQEVDENGNAVSYPKTAGTAEDTSFNAVVIDRDNNKIYAFCYGAGYDREISYESSKPTVVNQISISTDATGAVYNGVGYKDGIRFGSDGSERTNAATDATGFIPCTIADTLYFKNCQIAVLGGTSQTYQEIACYDSSKTYINKRYVDISAQMDGKDYSVDSDNNLTRYNCADLWTNTAFVRISGNYIGADSVITKNEPIE